MPVPMWARRRRPLELVALVVFKNTVLVGLFGLEGVARRARWGQHASQSTSRKRAYAEVNLVTALVPSDTACLASSPGSTRRTAVWISRLVIVGFLL